MHWQRSWKADPVARALADLHYNRHKVGAPQFVPPGRALVLRTPAGTAFWITSWPFAEYVRHAWAGAWVNSAFRNEGSGILSSELIREAVAATLAYTIIAPTWGAVPELGIISFVDARKVRHKRDPGRCYLKAGFKLVGKTKSGLLAFQMLPHEMPEPSPCLELPLARAIV